MNARTSQSGPRIIIAAIGQVLRQASRKLVKCAGKVIALAVARRAYTRDVAVSG